MLDITSALLLGGYFLLLDAQETGVGTGELRAWSSLIRPSILGAVVAAAALGVGGVLPLPLPTLFVVFGGACAAALFWSLAMVDRIGAQTRQRPAASTRRGSSHRR